MTLQRNSLEFEERPRVSDKNTMYTVHVDYRLLKINKYAIEQEKKVNDKTIKCKIPSKVEWTVTSGK